jgi:hypothetical protein
MLICTAITEMPSFLEKGLTAASLGAKIFGINHSCIHTFVHMAIFGAFHLRERVLKWHTDTWSSSNGFKTWSYDWSAMGSNPATIF